MRRQSKGRAAAAAAAAAVALLAAAPKPTVPAGPRPLQRIAFGSCLKQEREAPLLDRIVAFRPELFLFLGDNVYADTEDMERMHAAYSRLAAIPAFQGLRRQAAVLATWDDHDYGANDAGRDYPKRAESKEIFLDFWGEPKDSPRRRRPGVYDARTFGPPGRRVQVILLDTRYNRSPLKKRRLIDRSDGPYEPDRDPSTTILGEEQWAFVKEKLREPAELRLLCSSIQVIADDHDFEKWGNFPFERDRLFALLRETKAAGVVVLSGDRHMAELSALDVGIGYTLYDLTSSGINQAAYNYRALSPNRYRLGTADRSNNFGAVQLEWGKDAVRVSLEIWDEERGMALQRKLTLADLQPGALPR